VAWRVVAAVRLVLATVAVYANSLSVPFVFDDGPAIFWAARESGGFGRRGTH